MKLRFLILVALFISPVIGEAAPKNMTCAATLLAAKQYTSIKSQQAQVRDAALWRMRAHRGDTTGWETPGAGVADLSVSSKNISANQLSKMRSELYGIELFAKNPEGADLSKERILDAFEIKGKKEILDFYQDIDEISATAQNFVNTPDRRMIVFKRFSNNVISLGVSAISLLAKSVGFEFDLGDLILVWTGMNFIVSEPIDLFLYLRSTDGRFDALKTKVNAFVNSDATSTGAWAFDSWQYKPRMGMVTQLWNHGLANEVSRSAFRMQENWDSRGLFFKIYRPFEIKTSSKIHPSVRNQVAETETQGWVAFDQLLSRDENGEPILTFVVRAEVKRPRMPKKAPAIRNAYSVTPGELAPVNVPSN